MIKSLLIIFCLIQVNFSGYTQEWSTPEMLPEPVNVNAWSHFPFITHDSKRLYFASDREDHSTEDIYYCDWDGDKWGNAVKLNSNINTKHNRELSPSVTADGKTLYFVRFTATHSYDIFYSAWQDTGWGPAVNISTPINTDDIEWSCCISPDGEKLYFDCSYYIDTYPLDLCVSVKTDTGWSHPQRLFKNYDSNAGDESEPSISSDGNAIYFMRLRWVAEGRDIYYATWNGNAWSTPINIGAPINTPEKEMTPSISADGKTLYFSHMVVHPPTTTPKIYVSHRITKIDKIKSRNETIKNLYLKNYPNPFNLCTVIIFKTKINNQFVILKIYDINGKEVITLINKNQPDGKCEAIWNGSDNFGKEVSSGIYFCLLRVGSFSQTRKMILVR